MATAKLITDSKIRASILALARKWLDLAERGSSQQEALDRAACLRDIQTKIGQELREQYELPPELTHRMLTLLMLSSASVRQCLCCCPKPPPARKHEPVQGSTFHNP